MVDTARTVAELLSLFADNSTGDISAQDLRDFVVSMPPRYGSHVQRTFLTPYDQGDIDFDYLDGDPEDWYNAANKRIEVVGDGIYIVSAYIGLTVTSGSVTSGPTIEVALTSLPWNLDPLDTKLGQIAYAPNSWAGSLSFPLLLDDGCLVTMSTYWEGSATADISIAGLSVWRIGV